VRADPAPELAELPQAHGLVSSRWLAAELARPPDSCPLVLEVSWAKLAGAEHYHAGHIPGAVHLNTDDLEDGYPTWKLLPMPRLHDVIGALGIDGSRTVVVYGHQAIAAARAWWVLMYAGAPDVRILDGGFAAWSRAGFAADTMVKTPVPVRFSGEPRHSWLITTNELLARLDDPRLGLADVRSRAEFEGRVSGYDYLDRAGRIPGSIHAGNADDSERLYIRDDGSLRDPRDTAARWARAGIREPSGGRDLVMYCGSGWRSSMAFFHAWLLGWPGIRNYSDGWCSWSTRYVPDSAAAGSTPGWRQDTTSRPVACA
jgi:thiosulfate/3-mercaptopyruvate sulfurtransferase